MNFPHGCGNGCFHMDFPDVTLASEDGQLEEANKVVLSSASQKLNTEVLAQLLGEAVKRIGRQTGIYRRSRSLRQPEVDEY